HAAGAARREVPEVRRGGPGRAPHAQGTELLRMPALPRLRLLGVEPPRGDRLPELRLRGNGGEAVQSDGVTGVTGATGATGVTRKCLKCGHEVTVEEAAPTEQVAT